MKYLPAKSLKYYLFLWIGAFTCFTPYISPAGALGIGLVGTMFLNRGSATAIQLPIHLLLKVSIVLMGFGLSWSHALSSSWAGFGFTAVSVFSTLILGLLIGKLMRLDWKMTLLITVGTAICGGSAIATISPIINPKEQQLAFSLMVVFFLNALALLIFPWIGDYLNLNQVVFGQWAAIAIHDTSSVIGVGQVYGAESLQVATTLKLTRALWIIPMAFLLLAFNTKSGNKGVNIPWFILLFVVAMVIAHYLPQGVEIFEILNFVGRKGMIVVLFLIGCNFSFDSIKQAGVKPFLLGLTLWVIISVVSLQLLN